jgi:hypothetical protein
MSGIFKATKGAVKSALKNLGSGRSTRLSSRANSEMSIDPPADQPPTSSSAPPKKVLLKASQLVLKDAREREIFKSIKNKCFTHTLILDLGLLREAGMDAEFDLIFPLVGWDSFWNITELGSKLLTIEFLCTLQTTKDGVMFRFFKEKFTHLEGIK